MKLWYDKKSKDPTYFIQRGIRNGKKTTTKNVVRIGKHSELLKTTTDPLEYAKKEVQRYNEELKNNQTVALDFKFDFNEKITYQDDIVSKSKLLNIGYFFLQQIYHDLKIGSFFKSITKDAKIQLDSLPIRESLALTLSLVLIKVFPTIMNSLTLVMNIYFVRLI